MKRGMTRILLFSAGALLGVIGSALMVSPRAFLEMSHVLVDQDPGLMSELTAPSGVLILTGALMVLAAFKLRLAKLALTVGAVVYGSYGLGRLVSMALHGVPSDSLIAATMVELALALILGFIAMTKSRERAMVETGTHALEATAIGHRARARHSPRALPHRSTLKSGLKP